MKVRFTLTCSFLVSLTIVWALPGAFAASLDDATSAVFKQHSISRVTSEHEVSPKDSGSRSFTFNSTLNVPAGDSYVIVTDHDEPACLDSVNKLAQFHSARIIKLKDLRNLAKLPAAREFLLNQLKKSNPKFVAIMPRIENFSENTVLAFWQVLSSFGGGNLTVYPGFLVGRNANELEALINRSTANLKHSRDKLNTVVIAQAVAQKAGGMRAVEKAEIMEDLFHQMGERCDGMVVRTPDAPPSPKIREIGNLGTVDVSEGEPLRELPPNVVSAISSSDLLLLFGHGSPGMTCSVSVSAFDKVPMSNDIVLCGSCFSCTPIESDLMQSSNGKRPDSFAYHALNNGASVFWGHMHENSGFPQLFVAFEALMKGETVGQSYQRVLNCLIANAKVPQQQFIMSADQLLDKQAVEQRNGLLFIMIGDPAASPVSSAEASSKRK